MTTTTPREQIAVIYTVFEIHPRDDGKLTLRSVHIAARSSAEAERLWGAHLARLQAPRPLAYIQTDAHREWQDPEVLAVLSPGSGTETVTPDELGRWTEVQTRASRIDGERVPAAFRAIRAAAPVAQEE